ncbi:MAG TPA: hypothetical protein VK788_26245 [Terriglobales bacterium]|jgi:hypothetical protein|nr:hypothetical protein [Terriglobales bacterium]
MRLLRWAIVIVGVSFVSLASIVPKVDAQETAYDETDTPVNLTTPFVARTNFVAPVGHPVAIPKEQRVWSTPGTAMYGVTLRPRMRASYSLLNLLCELLC